MILTKLGQLVNDMMAVAVKQILNFQWSRFLIIRPNVHMATNAILHFGLPPIWTAQSDTSTAPISTIGTGRR